MGERFLEDQASYLQGQAFHYNVPVYDLRRRKEPICDTVANVNSG